MKVLLLLCLLVATAAAYTKDYTGYKVIGVTPRTDAEVAYIHSLEERLDLDFWLRTGHVDLPAHIMAAAEVADQLIKELTARDMEVFIGHNNVQEAIDWETKNHNKKVKENQLKGVAFAFDQYHSTEELHAFMDEMASAHEGVSTKVLGQTVEGRDLKQLMIGDGSKPVQFFDCQVHAREWIAAALCAWVVNEVITGSNGLKDNFDFAFVLPANVDGYEYTREHDRMWRKNRRINEGILHCVGVDPNRNFDSNHCGEGSSTNPCADTYCGPTAFSEPCTQVLRDSIQSFDKVAFAWSLHSYSQLMMSPYGYTKDLPSDFDAMKATMDEAAAAVHAKHNHNYGHGATAPTIYVASGGSSDWYYDAAGVTHAYTFECRPVRWDIIHGFLLPEDQIIPNSEEVFAGMLTASNRYLREQQ